MAKKNPKLCTVTFEQNGSKIKLFFEEIDNKVSFKADDSKFDDTEEAPLARSLSNFLLAQLIALYKNAQTQEEVTPEK